MHPEQMPHWHRDTLPWHGGRQRVIAYACPITCGYYSAGGARCSYLACDPGHGWPGARPVQFVPAAVTVGIHTARYWVAHLSDDRIYAQLPVLLQLQPMTNPGSLASLRNLVKLIFLPVYRPFLNAYEHLWWKRPICMVCTGGQQGVASNGAVGDVGVQVG